MAIPVNLTDRQLVRETWRLALPSIADNGLMALTMAVATMLASMNLGTHALAGIGAATVMIFCLQTFSMSLNFGGTALVAQGIGARQLSKAQRFAGQTLTLALILSVLFGFVSWLSSESIIRLLTSNSEQIALGTLYLHAYALFLPAMFALSVGCGLLRGAGETFTAMKCVGFYALAFIMFGYIMVAAPWTPNFNTPELVREGVRRLALANALAETVGALMALYYLLLRPSGFTFPVGEMWPLDRRVQKQIIQLCLPSAGEMGTMRLGFFVFNKILLTLGSAAFAAHRVAVSVEMLSFLPGFGFGVAATTLVGQAVGAQDYAFAERAVRRTARIATYVMVVTGAMLALFAGPLVKGLYNPEPEVAYLATWCVVVSALEQPMLGFMFTYSGALRGAGDTVSPMILRLIGSLAIRLPLAYAVATWTDWGVIGIWAAVVLEWAIGCVVVFWLFKKGRWRRTRLASLHQKATSEEPANPRA